jgi:hypothetical protein
MLDPPRPYWNTRMETALGTNDRAESGWERVHPLGRYEALACCPARSVVPVGHKRPDRKIVEARGGEKGSDAPTRKRFGPS